MNAFREGLMHYTRLREMLEMTWNTPCRRYPTV